MGSEAGLVNGLWFGSALIALLLGCQTPAPDQQMDGVEGATTASVPSYDGLPIAYELHGANGPALILVHGWSCDRSYWRGQIEDLAQNHRVVTIDLGGHGESGVARESWTIESFGQDVAGVANHLGLEHVILVGHSMGGDVILEAARHLPGRVQGLVWIDTYRELGSPRTAAEVEAIVAPFRTDFRGTTEALVRDMFRPDADSSLVNLVATDMAAAPPDIAIDAIESSLTYGRQVTTPLEQLGLPVVAINPSGVSNNIESMARYGVEVVLMDAVGHFMMMEDPARFNALLRDVIGRWK